MTRLALRCMTFPFPAYVIAQAIQIPHPHFSNAVLGRVRLPVHYLVPLSYLLQCEPDELIGWADGGIDSRSYHAEVPCIEDGIDIAVPPAPALLRHARPVYYDADCG